MKPPMTEKTATEISIMQGMTIREALEHEYRRGFFAGLRAEDAAKAVVSAYSARFEGRGPHKLFGPIDEEIIALKRALD